MGLQVGWHHQFYIEEYGGEVTILNFEGDESKAIIPPLLAGHPVVRIMKGAFNCEQAKNLETVMLPVNLVNIDEGAFQDDIKIERYFNQDMDGFEHEGTWITDPTLDETGRFEVNPLDYYGVEFYK